VEKIPEGKVEEVEPGVPEKAYAHFSRGYSVEHFQPLDERPPLLDAEGALPQARGLTFGAFHEAVIKTPPLGRSFDSVPTLRPAYREPVEHYKEALYSIASALYLSHALLSQERNRTPVGGAAWDILSQLSQNVSKIREQVVGLLEEKVEEVR
jgi:hypothetical protein